MRRGFLLSTPRQPRKPPRPTSLADPPPPPPSSNKPSQKEDKSSTPSPSSAKLISLPPKFIPRPTPPECPPDIEQRTMHLTQAPDSGPPEQLAVFIHYNGVLEALRAEYPGWPQAFSTPSPPVYKIVPIEGAGLGMVAAVDIAVGAVIVRERPIMLAPAAFSIAAFDSTAGHVFLRATQALHPVNKRSFYALKNAMGSMTSLEEEGIYYTNAYTCGPFPGYNGGYGGLARDLSRVNHSCSTNAEHRFDPATLTQSLHALRNIRAGEEITANYVPWLATCEERQEELRRHYSFTCTCGNCRLTGMARILSDNARVMIRSASQPDVIAEFDAAFATWLADGTPMRVPIGTSTSTLAIDPLSASLMLWELMVQEGWYDPNLWETVLARLVKLYAIQENEERVRYYATKAAGLRTAYTDSDGGWLAVAKNPTLTEWWGKRLRDGKT